MARARALVSTLAGIVVIGAAAVWAVRRGGSPAHGDAMPAPPTSIVVPWTHDKMVIDAEIEEPSWRAPGRTGAFTFAGSTEAARPYSDARVLRDASDLYLTLYAADEDQRRGADAFRLAFVSPADGSILTLSISVDKQVQEKRIAGGATSTWESGIRLAIDADGTLDDPSDEDEEWVVEAAIPLQSLGVTESTKSIRASFARCDTPKGSKEACGSWGLGPDGGIGGTLVLEP